MQNQNPNTSHAEFKKRNKKRKENCLFIYLFCLVFLQLNVRYNEKRVNFCPVLSPNYLLKNPSILALSYYSLGSCSGWWFSVLVFCFVSFTCVLCGFIFWGFFFISIAKKVQHSFDVINIYLFWQLESQAKKVVLHQVAITVLQ